MSLLRDRAIALGLPVLPVPAAAGAGEDWHIVTVRRVIGPATFYGPFRSREAAKAWVDAQAVTNWSISPVEPPYEEDAA